MNKGLIMKGNKAQKAVQVMLYFIIFLYPLILFEADLGGLHIQELALFVCVLGTLFYCFLQIRSNEWYLRKQINRTDLVGILLAVYEFGRIIHKLLSSNEAGAVVYDSEVLILSMAVIYLLLSTESVFDAKYFDALLFSGLIIFGILLYQYLCMDNVGSAVLAITGNFMADSVDTASYTLLVCVTALWQYCKCDDRMRSVFYGGVQAVGFFVLFLNHNILSIWLMAIVFIALPVFSRPTAELVKRNAQMTFVYLFMLSNMSLLTNYTTLIKKDVSYNLEQSVYLELLLAAGGLFFFHSWDRIPKGTDLRRLIMRKMQRWYGFCLKAAGAFLAGVLIGGGNWQKLSDTTGRTALKSFILPLVNEINQGKSMFYFWFDDQGIIGGILLLIFCLLMASSLRKNFDYARPFTCILSLVAVLFLVELLFWKVGVNVLPVYFVFFIFAIFYKEEREKVTSTKIKFE